MSISLTTAKMNGNVQFFQCGGKTNCHIIEIINIFKLIPFFHPKLKLELVLVLNILTRIILPMRKLTPLRTDCLSIDLPLKNAGVLFVVPLIENGSRRPPPRKSGEVERLNRLAGTAPFCITHRAKTNQLL
jgi:hypothetical protein